MSERFDAEEAAFREALTGAAESEGFEPLAADDLPRSPRLGLNWPTAAAAVAVIGVVALLGATVLPYLGQAAAPSSAGAPAEAPAPQPHPQPPDQNSPEMAPTVPEPEPGWRWESFRDVIVQVPQDWGYGLAPTSAWCIDESDWPTAPYVDVAHDLGAVAAILCEGVMPAERLVSHLELAPEAIATTESLPGGWTAHRAVVGEVAVTVVTDADGAAVAEQIVASARQVSVDHNGCPVAVPATVEVDLAGLTGFPIVVCAYDSDTGSGSGLRSSARLEGEAATLAWDAVFAAPGGGGPDDSQTECGGLPAETGAVLLVEGNAISFQFGGCTGNGLADAGAERSLREVTTDLCRTLLVPPFWMNSAIGPAAGRCLGVLADR